MAADLAERISRALQPLARNGADPPVASPPRNELVSIPHAVVIGGSIVNDSLSRRELDQPMAVATTITTG